MHEKGVLHEVNGKKRDSARQSSGLLVEVDEEELVDYEGHDVEDGSGEVHNGHST